MTEYTAKDATLTVGGVPFEVKSVSWSRRAEPESEAPALTGGTYSGTGEMTVSVDVFAGMLETVLRLVHPKGASPATLYKRAVYGGRKGRRAMRRLRAMQRGRAR